jgi:nucleoid DNA-binding protein
MAKNSIGDLAAILARKQKIGKKEANDMVTAFFATITDGLRDDRQVKVRGLGTFKVTTVKARESVDVNTGNRVVIEGHDKVSFTPDTTMKDLVNKPFAQFTTVVVNDGVNFDSVDVASASEERNTAAVDNDSDADSDSFDDVDEEESVEDRSDDDVESEEKKEVPVTNEVEQSEIIDVTAETVDDGPSNDAPQAADSKQDNTAADSKPASDNEQVNPVGTPSAAVVEQNNEVAREADNALNHSEDRVKEDDATTQVLDSYIPDDTPEPTDTLEHTAHNNDSMEEKSTDEPHDNSRTEKEDDGDDQPIVSREYFDEQMSACRRRCNRNLILSVVLLVVGLVAGFLAGRYLMQPQPVVSSKPQVKQVKKVVAQPDTATAAPAPKDTVEKNDTVAAPVAPVEDKKKESDDEKTAAKDDDVSPEIAKMNADRRLRFGAYEIIGVEKVVKLKPGQTMQSYSNKTLGKDMVVYFQVLNGVDEMKPGEPLKVPKIRLKKQYRK